jgi:predicted nucleotidyltransferase
VADNIPLDLSRIRDLCRRWRITEFSLFGSVLRDDFRPNSDVDVLVTFDAGAPWSLFDIVGLQDELTAMFGREAHVVEARALRNPFRRAEILRTRKVVYAA